MENLEDFLGLRSGNGENVEDFQVVRENLGKEGVVAGEAALLEGHILAEIAGQFAEGITAALHDVRANRTAAGVAGALLGIQLFGGAFDFGAGLGLDRALTLVGVVANDGLLEQGGADDAAEEGFIDLELADFAAFDIENWHFNHDFALFLIVNDGLGLTHKKQPAVGSGNRSLDEQEVLLFVDADEHVVAAGHRLVTEVTSHLFALLDRTAVTAGCLAAADTAGRPVLTFSAVRTGLTAEVPAFHNPLETLALTGSGDIDVLDGVEEGNVNGCASGEGGFGGEPNFFKVPFGRGLAGFCSVRSGVWSNDGL